MGTVRLTVGRGTTEQVMPNTEQEEEVDTAAGGLLVCHFFWGEGGNNSFLFGNNFFGQCGAGGRHCGRCTGRSGQFPMGPPVVPFREQSLGLADSRCMPLRAAAHAGASGLIVPETTCHMIFLYSTILSFRIYFQAYVFISKFVPSFSSPSFGVDGTCSFSSSSS